MNDDAPPPSFGPELKPEIRGHCFSGLDTQQFIPEVDPFYSLGPGIVMLLCGALALAAGKEDIHDFALACMCPLQTPKNKYYSLMHKPVDLFFILGASS